MRIAARILLALISSAFMGSSAFLPAAAAQEKNQPIVLEHADSLVGMEIAGEPARQLVGNVRFRQGGLVLTCARAIQYLRSNKVYFDGTVQAVDDSVRIVGQRAVYYPDTRVVEALDRVLLEEGATTLQARYGTYSANERVARFRDRVVVADTATVLTAGHLRYDRDRQFIEADSAVRIEDQANDVVTFSDHFENDKPGGYARWTGSPRLLQAGPPPRAGEPAETLRVSGVTMESYGDSARRLVVTDSVRIFREGLSGTAGLAVFHLGRDSVELLKNPYLWYREPGGVENQVTGDSVMLLMKDRRADRLRVVGSALASSEADSVLGGRYNQLAGQEIILYFHENALGRIDVERTATSLYYLFEDGRPNGLNRASGNAVTIAFREGRVESIKLVENVEGKYIPENMVAGKETEYDLPGFRWRTDKPEPPVF